MQLSYNGNGKLETQHRYQRASIHFSLCFSPSLPDFLFRICSCVIRWMAVAMDSRWNFVDRLVEIWDLGVVSV